MKPRMVKVRELEIGMFFESAGKTWKVDGVGKEKIRVIDRAKQVKVFPYPDDPDVEVKVIYEVTDEYAKQLIEQTLEGTEI